MAVDNQFITNILMVGLVIAIIAILVIQYRQSTTQTKEHMDVPAYGKMPSIPSMPSMPAMMPKGGKAQEKFSQSNPINSDPAPFIVQEEMQTQGVMPSEPLENDKFRAVDFVTESKLPTESCFPRDKTTADQLLPENAANSLWAQVAPAGQGDVQDQNFLTAGYMIGIDTVGQSLRNANYQLRSDIPNPRFQVGPWMQSTIEFDNSHKFFEIGGDSCS